MHPAVSNSLPLLAWQMSQYRKTIKEAATLCPGLNPTRSLKHESHAGPTRARCEKFSPFGNYLEPLGLFKKQVGVLACQGVAFDEVLTSPLGGVFPFWGGSPCGLSSQRPRQTEVPGQKIVGDVQKHVTQHLDGADGKTASPKLFGQRQKPKTLLAQGTTPSRSALKKLSYTPQNRGGGGVQLVQRARKGQARTRACQKKKHTDATHQKGIQTPSQISGPRALHESAELLAREGRAKETPAAQQGGAQRGSSGVDSTHLRLAGAPIAFGIQAHLRTLEKSGGPCEGSFVLLGSAFSSQRSTGIQTGILFSLKQAAFSCKNRD